MAPDGTVWAATEVGVFSFDGEEWTRSFDDRMATVAVDEGGTVWITEGGQAGWAVAVRRDGESWEEVVSSPERGCRGAVDMAVLPGGEVWVTAPGYGCSTSPLMRYDGATLEDVEVADRPFLGSYVSAVEAAPNGDLWVGGFLGGDPGVSRTGVEPLTDPPVLARFDGERWTVYDSPPYDPSGGCYSALLDLAVGPDGVVWWASGSGLVSFDGTEWTTHIDGRWVGSVDVAPDGTVWYADDYGILALRPLRSWPLGALWPRRLPAGPVPAEAACPPGSTPTLPATPPPRGPRYPSTSGTHRLLSTGRAACWYSA